MWTYTILFNIFLLTTAASEDPDLRVVNGRETFQRFLVELFIKVPNEHIKCSASVLNQHWVITSGHCFDEGPILYVRISRFTAPAQAMAINRIVVHPLYRPKKVNGLLDYVRHDLALLKTREPMALDGYIQPVPLDRIPPMEGIVGTVSGYGLPELEAREGDMQVSYCNGMLCTHSFDQETRPGQGDSGGPYGKLVGVDSTSVQVKITENKRRTRVFHTEYFADIASNYDWIQSVVDGWPDDVNGLLRTGSEGV